MSSGPGKATVVAAIGVAVVVAVVVAVAAAAVVAVVVAVGAAVVVAAVVGGCSRVTRIPLWPSELQC